MSYSNSKWKQHYTQKAIRVKPLPLLINKKHIRAASIDEIILKTQLDSQREEITYENQLKQEVPEEIKPRSLTILKEPYMREYDEDITSIYNRCSQKIIEKASKLPLITKENQKQKIQQILATLYTTDLEKKININFAQSERPLKHSIKFELKKYNLDKDKIDTIYDPSKYYKLYEKIKNDLEFKVPQEVQNNFKKYLMSQRNLRFKLN